MKTGRNGTLDLDLVRHPREARIARVPPVSIEDRPLLWMVVRSHTYYPKHILAYGSRKTCYALVVGSGFFRTDWLEAEKGGGLSTILRPGLKCGAWSPSLDEDLNPSTRVEWFGLVCARGTNVVCVSGYPAGIHWFMNRRFYETVPTWLWSSTVVRTRIWKMVKWFWLLTTCLKVAYELT